MLRFRFRRAAGAAAFALVIALGPVGAEAQSGSAIQLTVDATQAPEKIVTTHMVVPVKPGPMTFYFPKWIPGEHEPDGPIASVAGLKFTANGETIPWRRDLLDVFTFHVNIPQGADRLEVDFDYLEPTSGPYSGGASATDKLVVISWNDNLLYPAGIRAQDITYQPTLKLPQGWKYGTALPVESQSADEVRFKPVALNRLVDSPVIAGEYYRAIDVTPAGEPIHHELDLVADSEAALAITPEEQKGMTRLVAETGNLFGTRHYRDYHFLLTLSDHVAHFGLEHHESDDSRINERTLISPGGERRLGGLLAHEFVHSWNGKFRRPADLSAPYYEEPMKTDLLWVYEGLTEYLGDLLATRSGLWTPEQYRQNLANIAASLGRGTPGRTWRPLQDTADAIPGMFHGGGFESWRRDADYYPEGELIWLDCAMTMRRVSHGKKSFEDFARSFYGGPNHGPELKPYTFDQLVSALNQVVPYDWAHFFRERLDSTSPESPQGGIEQGGWKLAFDDQPPRGAGGGGRFGGGVDARYSLGLRVGSDGRVFDSLVGSPAYKAGVMSGMTIVAVNGRAFATNLVGDAIKESAASSAPIDLLVEDDEYFSDHKIDYHGGERYPHLVRDDTKPDWLDDNLKPLASAP